MAHRLAAVLTVLVLTLAAGASRGDDLAPGCPVDPAAPIPEPAADELPPALLVELAGWIALNTMYDVSQLYHAPPEISFCDVGDEVDYEEGHLLVDPLLHAAYDLPRRRIHLVRPWSPDDPYDVSVLLHELIHDVQLANRDWDCVGAPEREAYWLQDKWLAERGIDARFNWSAIRQLSTCPPPSPENE